MSDRPVPPISRAKRIAKDFKLDQVLILGRSVGGEGYQTMTTYGKNRGHCDAAAILGGALMELLTKEGTDFEAEECAVHEANRESVRNT